jgi:acetyl-CoA carboxylase biotin carboxylase subunit
LEKVLVANRGEIALRIVRACRELGLRTVAVYSEADASARHVARADEAVCIGPPRALESYLNVEAIIAAARSTGADAVHPGYGFLAENAAFARACREEGLTFVGPGSAAIETMGDKAEARRLAARAGVPTVSGTDGAASLAGALALAAEIGYPVLVKAAAGGGGRGIRVAADEDELRSVFPHAAAEAGAAFGDDSVYVEKFIPHARHVEVQVLGDAHGNLVHLFERECSLQRRRQKLLEEAPSPGLSAEARAALVTAGLDVARAIGYENAGTVEFLVDADGRFFFIEMNTRIQVEHPVTEMVTGVDLVHEQIRIAEGRPLGFGQDDVVLRGAAIEVRINAEDPANAFMPSPGEITHFELPSGAGVRVDTAAYPGYRVPPFYDSMIAKLIVRADRRDAAIARLEEALAGFRVEGIASTIPFFRDLLADDAVRGGDYDVEYVEHRLADSGRITA